MHRALGVVEGIGITTIRGDIDFSVGAVQVTGKVTCLNAAHVAGRHPLYRNAVAILIGIEHIATAGAGRRQIARNTTAVGGRNPLANPGRIGIGNRQSIDIDRNVAECRFLPAATLPLRTGSHACRTTAGYVGILVVDRNPQADGVISKTAWCQDGVAVGQALQCFCHPGRRRAGVEADGQRATGLGERTDRHARQNNVTGCTHHGSQITARSKLVVRAGAARPREGDLRPRPVVSCRQLEIVEAGIGVDHDRRTALNVQIGGCGIQTRYSRRIINRIKRDAACGGASSTTCADGVRIGVPHRPGDGPGCCQIVASRVFIRVVEGNASECRLIISQRIGAGQRQCAG